MECRAAYTGADARNRRCCLSYTCGSMPGQQPDSTCWLPVHCCSPAMAAECSPPCLPASSGPSCALRQLHHVHQGTQQTPDHAAPCRRNAARATQSKPCHLADSLKSHCTPQEPIISACVRTPGRTCIITVYLQQWLQIHDRYFQRSSRRPPPLPTTPNRQLQPTQSSSPWGGRRPSQGRTFLRSKQQV